MIFYGKEILTIIRIFKIENYNSNFWNKWLRIIYFKFMETDSRNKILDGYGISWFIKVLETIGKRERNFKNSNKGFIDNWDKVQWTM